MSSGLLRRAILVGTTLVLSGCITVDDFGAFWDKDRLDGDLAGRWVAVKTADGDDGEMTFIRRGRSYVVLVREGDEKAKGADEQVRTLRVGESRFLLSRVRGKANGMMTAYRVTHDQLELLDVPDVVVGVDVPLAPASVKYSRKSEAPASVEIATLDQPALEWLDRLMRLSRPTSVFARRRR